MITIDEFKKIDIRIAKVLEAERIEGAKKLLKLKVDIGGEERQIVAGIAETYQPEDLIDRKIPLIVNLEPATIRGIESQGMILAVDIGNKAILLNPDEDVPEGSKVR